MSEANIEYKEPAAQKYVIWIAIVLFVIALLAYALVHGNWEWPFNLSKKTDVWGELGDYLGGVINPIIGLLTIWLLTVSLKQTHRELALSRRAVENAEVAQKATETALREQIDLARKARDLDNVVTSYSALLDVQKRLKAERAAPLIRGETVGVDMIQKNLDEVNFKRGILLEIITREADRVIKSYEPDK